MAFSYTNSRGVQYFLHHKENTGRGKGELFYFSKSEKNNEMVDYVPKGYLVVENPKTGLPLLKRQDKMQATA